ncbi:MAG: 3-deoxy-D-manno-octulosonic acid transferase [Phycisphaerae bacterium]
MPPLLLDCLYLSAALLYLPYLLYQMLVLKKNRRGWKQRFGGIPQRAGDRRCIWIHAVSLGEVNATQSLVAAIMQCMPDCEIVISATTDTGYAAARRHYPNHLVFRFPLDFSFAVNRVFNRIRPDAVVLMELEVWPNFIEIAARRGIPVGIANGRVTEEKSMRRYGRPILRGIARRMFSKLAWTAAQNETYATRFKVLGARPESITVTGSMKYDTALIAECSSGDSTPTDLGIDRTAPLIVAGSTGPGEEAMLLDAFAALSREIPTLQLAIIPRKPERFDEVARLIESRGYHCRRRSEHRDHSADAGIRNQNRSSVKSGRDDENPMRVEDGSIRPTIHLGDTMGELRRYYALADAVFVGRSLVPLGGSDLMEVAALGRPMCFGRHVENFADTAEALLAAEAALSVRETADLEPVLGCLLRDKDRARAMGDRARDVILRHAGATQQTVDLLRQSLDRPIAR